jgi:hypothetical protein
MSIEITSTPARTTRAARSSSFWAFIVTGVAIFMVSLDNLVVATALPAIRAGLGAGPRGSGVDR